MGNFNTIWISSSGYLITARKLIPTLQPPIMGMRRGWKPIRNKTLGSLEILLFKCCLIWYQIRHHIEERILWNRINRKWWKNRLFNLKAKEAKGWCSSSNKINQTFSQTSKKTQWESSYPWRKSMNRGNCNYRI